MAFFSQICLYFGYTPPLGHHTQEGYRYVEKLMRDRNSSHIPPQGPYTGERLPADDIASAIGCTTRDPYVVRDTFLNLCKQCVIRFGVPPLARSQLTAALGLPPSQTLAYPTIGEQIDPRWAQLADVLELPQPGELPITSIRITSPTAHATIKQAVVELKNDLASSRLIPIPTAVAEKLRHHIEIVKGFGAKEKPDTQAEVRPIVMSAIRQLKLHLEQGSEWSLVTPKELLVLRASLIAVERQSK